MSSQGHRSAGYPMKNVTITLDRETAAWTRVHAAQRNQSVSRFVGEVLREHMREAREYDVAMKRYLTKGPFKLTGPPSPIPSARSCMTGPCFVDADVFLYA